MLSPRGMAPLFLLLAPATFSVRTLHLQNITPSQLTMRLAASTFTQELECLTPDDSRKTLTVSGPTAAVQNLVQVVRWLDIPKRQLELLVEIEETPGVRLRSRIELDNNETGIVTLFGNHTRHRFQLIPHLNGDKTLSLAVGVENLQNLGGRPARQVTSGLTSFVRFSPNKPIELRAPIGARGESGPAFLPLRITTRLKK